MSCRCSLISLINAATTYDLVNSTLLPNDHYYRRSFPVVIAAGRGLDMGLLPDMRHFNVLSDHPSQERQAVVIRVLSNRGEGLGPDVDFYIEDWVEAHELPETEPPIKLVFGRGTDGKVYLDGRLTNITLLP
jgi:hypothetical protein